MEDSRVLVIGAVSCMIASVSIAMFYLVSNAVELFSFSGELFKAGGWYRLLTFSFTHVNASHLWQNVIALGVVFLLTWEIPILKSHYIMSFFGSSFLIALANLVAFPSTLIAGASVGVYALFGSISGKGSNFLSRRILIPMLSAPLIIQSVVQVTKQGGVAQVVLHLAGFMIGLAFILIIVRVNRVEHVRILQMAQAEMAS